MPEKQFIDMLWTAMMQARLIAAAYAGRVGELAEDAGANFKIVEEGNSLAAVLYFRDHTHLAVIGTNDIHDWVDNFSAGQTSYRGMKVHSGFARCAIHLADRLEEAGFYAASAGKPVIVGGHSAGGAIAQLLTVLFKYREVDPREHVVSSERHT